jgi:tripartite-type tricarboxylate transporter receptor subunit TctC
VPIAVLGLAPLIAQARNGGVRIVAITSPQRLAAIPSVPTLTELGYPQIALTQWAGLVAPSATPVPIVKRLSDEMLNVLAMDEVRQLLVGGGIDPRPMGSSEFDQFLQDNVSAWEQVVPTLNLKLE